jgi:seryl-tRNA synthetase
MGHTAAAMSTDPGADGNTLLLHDLGVDGVYARGALYEDIVWRLTGYISRQGGAGAQTLRFPPVMSRGQIEKSGYLQSFPNLLGCVCALHGSESSIRAAAQVQATGDDWTGALSSADLVLTPAACYPLYPLVAQRGPLPDGGLLFDVSADCFRHEPSRALDRLQSFRMREFVHLGPAAEILAFRAGWMERGKQMAEDLALPCTLEVANDPFFGRVGQMMAMTQREQALKFELLVPYQSDARPTACMSFNYHQDHFTSTWEIAGHGGSAAHSGCVAFGIDRLVTALFCVHGFNTACWPATARRALAFD